MPFKQKKKILYTKNLKIYFQKFFMHLCLARGPHQFWKNAFGGTNRF